MAPEASATSASRADRLIAPARPPGGEDDRDQRQQDDDETTALTSGSCWPSRIAPKIHSGSVFCAPAVNVVTMTSSKDSAKASSAPETSAVAVSGSVT